MVPEAHGKASWSRTIHDILTVTSPAGSGRLQPFDLLDFKKFEGPLLMKAVIQNLAPETPLANDR